MQTKTIEPKRVEKLSFRTTRPQVYYCGWTGEDRICRYQGKCISCHLRTYGFDDGQDDPRGPLGDRASAPFIAKEYDMIGPDVPCCFLCVNNEEWRYNEAVRRAKKRSKSKEL